MENLRKACEKLNPYYDIDKIKPYVVYVWSKETGDDKWDSKNVFDICADKIYFYEEHTIPVDALSIIKEIQHELKLLEEE